MAENTDSLWAWVTRTPDGHMSLVGMKIAGSGENFPLISHNETFIRGLRLLARAHGDATGQQIFLREYHTFTDHEKL